jgi:hypothetical protein
MASDQILLSWQAPEFRHYEKNIGWYVTLFAIAILIIGYELFQQDFFGALTIGILTFFVLLFGRQRPQVVTIELTAKAVKIEDFYIPYKSIRHFWIVNNSSHKTLNIETTAYLNRFFLLELEDQDPEAVRELLLQVLPEHSSTEETFSQRLRHRLKF